MLDPESARSFDMEVPPEGYFQDPSPYFAALRHHDPMHRNADGSVLLTRYQDVRAVWRDLSCTVEKDEMFNNRWGSGPLTEHFLTGMLFRDPPDHDRLRAILNPFFNRASIAKLAPAIDDLVDLLLGDILERGDVDFLSDFAFRLPTSVICLVLGVPFEDGKLLHQLSERVSVPLNPNATPQQIQAGHHAVAELKAYFSDEVSRVRARPALDAGKDMISALAASQRAGDPISDDEIIHTAILMFNGGHGTTMSILSSALHHLIDNPDQMRDLCANPGLIETAVEEMIRFVTPIQMQWRRTTKPVTLSAGEIGPATEIVLLAGAANRDETAFDAPDILNLRRDPNRHMAWGAGVHMCIGRPLARLQLAIALSKLLARTSRIERTGPALFKHLPRFRKLDSLPVRLS